MPPDELSAVAAPNFLNPGKLREGSGVRLRLRTQTRATGVYPRTGAFGEKYIPTTNETNLSFSHSKNNIFLAVFAEGETISNAEVFSLRLLSLPWLCAEVHVRAVSSGGGKTR